ncbi:MAG: cupin domain-containing protein, partial [Allomuricauda sp.]
MNKVDYLIEKFKLRPHPEGGYFKETYRSLGEIEQRALSKVYSDKRNYSTCIYFLLTSDTFSAFHKINQD